MRALVSFVTMFLYYCRMKASTVALLYVLINIFYPLVTHLYEEVNPSNYMNYHILNGTSLYRLNIFGHVPHLMNRLH